MSGFRLEAAGVALEAGELGVLEGQVVELGLVAVTSSERARGVG